MEDGGATTALLGRSDLFADSLASGALQGKLDAPLLLTPSDRLDDRVARELRRLKAGRVVILGGERAISPAVEQALARRGLGTERLAGADRVDTAIAIARRYFRGGDTVIVARATGSGSAAFVDSLSAGGLGANRGWPIVLSATDRLSPATATYLEDAGIRRAIVAGGTKALSGRVERELKALGIEVERAAGADRYGTSLMLSSNVEGEGGTYLPLVVGTRDGHWASGFAAALAGQDTGVVVVPGDGVQPDLYGHLINGRPQIVCGPAVPSATCRDAAMAASVPDFFQEGIRLAVLSGDGTVDDGVAGAEGGMELRPTADPRTVCYNLFYDGLDPSSVTAAHIHAGDATVSGGPAVIDIVMGMPFGDPTDIYGCTRIADADVVRDVFANPQQYYVNVHTTDHPAGAIRGQLVEPSFAGLAEMTGDQEVPGPGDEQAFGFGAVFGNADVDDEVCVIYFAFTSSPLVAAHLHDGEAGTAGPPVVTFETLEADRFLNGECVDTDDPALVDRIAADPDGFYVNLHTETHPDGAVRGQLAEHWPAVDTTDRVPASFRDAARA